MFYMADNHNRLSWLNVDLWHRAGYAGRGMRFCVVDADTDISLTRYPKKITAYKDSGKSDWHTNHGYHGLLTLDIIQQICPDAEILFAGWQYRLEDIIRHCIDEKIDIVNASLLYNYVPVTHTTSQKAIDRGMMLFASAGNNGDLPSDLLGYPAKKGTWVAVGAATVSGWGNLPERVDYSSTGAELEVMGMTHLWTQLPEPFGKMVYTGTSCASPTLASCIALYEQKNGDITKEMARAMFEEHCVDMYEPGRDRMTGWGMFKLPHPETGEIMKEIVLTIEDKIAKVNGQAVEIDSPPVILNDRTMVPLSFIGRLLGAEVEWDAETRKVKVRG